MTLRARVDRHKCIGAGNCITLAPTAFDWLRGDFGKSRRDVEKRLLPTAFVPARVAGTPSRRGLTQ